MSETVEEIIKELGLLGLADEAEITVPVAALRPLLNAARQADKMRWREERGIPQVVPIDEVRRTLAGAIVDIGTGNVPCPLKPYRDDMFKQIGSKAVADRLTAALAADFVFARRLTGVRR